MNPWHASSRRLTDMRVDVAKLTESIWEGHSIMAVIDKALEDVDTLNRQQRKPTNGAGNGK